MANSEDVIVPADLEDDVAGSASALRVSPWCAPWLWSAVKVWPHRLTFASPSFSLALVTRTFYSMWRVVLPVAGETEFELLGFIFVMLASFMAGLRWVLLQVLLQPQLHSACVLCLLSHTPQSSVRPPSTPTGLTNPLLMLLQYLAPVMALVCGIFSLLHRAVGPRSPPCPTLTRGLHALWTLAVMPVGGVPRLLHGCRASKAHESEGHRVHALSDELLPHTRGQALRPTLAAF
ncbi:unnamed protein product [Closterium sp. NIES-64]|nr:unnamed protein product [Closterium sp. NIES-64]